MKGIVSKLSLVLGVLAVLSLGACPPPVSSSSDASSTSSSVAFDPIPGVTAGATEVIVGFDFTGAYSPVDFGVVPFVIGDMNVVLEGAAAWAGDAGNPVISNSIKADGTGPAVLTKIGDIYYARFITADDSDYSINFKAANYNTNGYTAVTNNTWATIGNQSTGTANENLVISNYTIVSHTLNGVVSTTSGSKTNGVSISSDFKKILIDVGAHGGWSIHVVGTLSQDLSLTVIWTNVPSWNHKTTESIGWLVFDGLISNTNSGLTSETIAVVTGSKGYLHNDGIQTWTPTNGRPVTLDAVAKTGKIVLTVPAGETRSVTLKMATSNDWNRGEEQNDQALPLPDVSVATQYLNFSRSADNLD